MVGRRGLGIWLLPPAWVERLEKAELGGGANLVWMHLEILFFVWRTGRGGRGDKKRFEHRRGDVVTG